MTTDRTVIAHLRHLLRREPKRGRGETDRRLLLAVDRLAFDDDRAQQDAERLGVRHRAAPVEGGDVAIEQGLQAEARDEVIDEG